MYKDGILLGDDYNKCFLCICWSHYFLAEDWYVLKYVPLAIPFYKETKFKKKDSSIIMLFDFPLSYIGSRDEQFF